jgi:hypothetical protein
MKAGFPEKLEINTLLPMPGTKYFLRSNALFSDVRLIFEKAEERRTTWVVRKNQELYEVKPARKKIGWSDISVFQRSQKKLRVKIIPINDLNSRLKA